MATDYKRSNNVSKRVRFYDGQFLQDQDFIDEQKFHLDRQARLGGSLQVAGVVDGLMVTAADQPFFVNVSSGTAVDIDGHALVLGDSRSELDKDGLAIIRPAHEPFGLASDTANSEQLLYLAYCQLPTDLQQSQEGLQGETRWHEAPFLFLSKGLLGSDDDYERPLWTDYLETRPTPILLARLMVAADGVVTVAAERSYSGLRLPGPNDGASWMMTADNRIQLRYGQEQTSQTSLTVLGGNVGIGTETPTAVLEIAGTSWNSQLKLSNVTDAGAGPSIYFSAKDRDWAIIGTNSSAGIGAEKLGFFDVTANAYRMVLDQNGHLGVGTDTPGGHRLHVAGGSTQLGGDLNISGTSQFSGNLIVGQHQTLSFANQTRQMINLWGQSNGIGIQNSTHYFRTGKNFAWYRGGSHDTNELNPGGGGVAQMVIKNDLVGIATNAPTAFLEVRGTNWSQHLKLSNVTDAGGGPGIYFNAKERDWAILGTNSSAGVGTEKLGFFDVSANAYRMVIDKAGNVGIGATNPTAKLEVTATAKTVGGWYEALRFSQAEHSAITHPGGGLLFGLHGNRHFYFADIKDGTFQKYVMTMNADSGNMGIGTNDPGSYRLNVANGNTILGGKLTVSGGTAINSNFSVNGTTTLNGNVSINAANSLSFDDGTRQMINLWRTEYGIGVQSSTQYFRTWKNFAWYKGGSHNNNALNAGTGGVVQMVINDGNVGIGTNNPQAKLDVVGGGGQTIDIQVNGRIKSNNNDGGLFVAADRFIGGHSTNKVGFYNSGWRLTVQANGNVGIGTMDPAQPLDVNGNAIIRGTRLYSSNEYGMLEMNGSKTWLRINPDGHYGSLALYRSVAVEHGLCVGSWEQLGQGQLKTTSTFICGGHSYFEGEMYKKTGGAWYRLAHGAINTLDGRHAFWESDQRLKKDIVPLQNALDKIRQLQGVFFHWNTSMLAHKTEWVDNGIIAAPNSSEEENQRVQMQEKQKIAQKLAGQHPGLIAQQVEKVLPALVKTNEKGIKGVDYGLLSVFLIEAFKELDTQMTGLTKQVASMANE